MSVLNLKFTDSVEEMVVMSLYENFGGGISFILSQIKIFFSGFSPNEKVLNDVLESLIEDGKVFKLKDERFFLTQKGIHFKSKYIRKLNKRICEYKGVSNYENSL